MDVPWALVHNGFYKAYNDVSSNIKDYVTNLFQTHKFAQPSILVTGHSLGAALATLCAADLKRNGLTGKGMKLYNFGSPRVGN